MAYRAIDPATREHLLGPCAGRWPQCMAEVLFFGMGVKFLEVEKSIFELVAMGDEDSIILNVMSLTSIANCPNRGNAYQVFG